MREANTPDELQLPVRASIYLAPDGTVHFGALFEELVPVARALGAKIDLEPGPTPDPRPTPLPTPAPDQVPGPESNGAGGR